MRTTAIFLGMMMTFTRRGRIKAIEGCLSAALESLRDLTGVPAADLDDSRVRVLTRDVVARDLAPDGDLTRLLASRLPSDEERALDLARDLVGVLARAVNRVGALVRTLDAGGDCVLARELVFSLDRAHPTARALDIVCSRLDRHTVGWSFAGLVESALRNATRLLASCEKAAAGRQAVRVSGAARFLVEVASRVIPPGERPRYGEEWRCELWELGQGRRRRRRRQIAHAVRLLSRSWGVRGGVRAARRRPAGG